MNDNCLLIFVKNPEKGKVKTRLAAGIGDEKALEIYKELLSHTCNISSKTNAKKIVFYSEFIDQNDLWNNSIFDKQLQSGLDLGEKMKNAFQYAFGLGFKNVSIIGSDCFDISTEIIEKSFSNLTLKDAAIGPAEDGGYYLIGLNSKQKNKISSLFKDINWSTSSVFKETIKLINQNSWNYDLLPLLNDIDDETDLQKHLNRH